MSGVVRRRARARQDLVEIYRHLAREAGLKTADRFLSAAEATLNRLARMPGIGARFDAEDPALGDIRHIPVSSRFRNLIVFYRPTTDGIEVARVLHGARDLLGLLAEQPPEIGGEADADEDEPRTRT